LLHELRQPGQAERESCIEQARVSALQQQVEAELVAQQLDDEALAARLPSMTPTGA